MQVALFFQQEVAGRASRLTAAAFPVLLLSGDNTQVGRHSRAANG